MDSAFDRGNPPRPRQSSTIAASGLATGLGGRPIQHDRLVPRSNYPMSVSLVPPRFSYATGNCAQLTNPMPTADFNIRQLRKKARRDWVYGAQDTQDAAAVAERQKHHEQQQPLQPDLSVSTTKELSRTRRIGNTSLSSRSLAGPPAHSAPRRQEVPPDTSLLRQRPTTSTRRLTPWLALRCLDRRPATENATAQTQPHTSSPPSPSPSPSPSPPPSPPPPPSPSQMTNAPTIMRYSPPPPHHSTEAFHFPRPQKPEDIEAMFEHVRAGLGLEQKWQIVYNDARLRWEEEERVRRRTQQRTSTSASASASAAQASPVRTVYAKGTPEWYLRQFTDQTVTAKHVGSLTVSLRTLPIDWLSHFVELQGVLVLARTLLKINAKRSLRRDSDVATEYQLLKCIKLLLNHESVANDAATNPVIINTVACSFDAPHIPSRRLVAEILTFMCYYNNSIAHQIVLQGLDQLSAANNETGRYDFWFKSLESILAGRGRMGSLIGASQDIRKHRGTEVAALNEYAQMNLILINGILSVDDFEFRVHHRWQMEAAHLRRILDLCRELRHEVLDLQIAVYEALQAEDQEILVSDTDQEIRDLSGPSVAYPNKCTV